MYVYKPVSLEKWSVGYETKKGTWVPESYHDTAITAAARTAWLNGQPGVCPHCGQPTAKEVYGPNKPLRNPLKHRAKTG